MSFRAGPRCPFTLVHIVGPFIDTLGREELEQTYLPLCQAWERDSIIYEICHSLVQTDLSSLTDDWVSIRDGADDSDRQAVAKRLTILLALLRIVPSGAVRNVVSNPGQALTESWAKTMADVHQRLASHRNAYSTGLVPMCIELARSLGSVTFEVKQGESRMTSMSD